MNSRKVVFYNVAPVILSLFHFLGGLPEPWSLLYGVLFGNIAIFAFLFGGVYCVLINSYWFKLPLNKVLKISLTIVTLNIALLCAICLFAQTFTIIILVLLALLQYVMVFLAWGVVLILQRRKINS